MPLRIQHTHFYLPLNRHHKTPPRDLLPSQAFLTLEGDHNRILSVHKERSMLSERWLKQLRPHAMPPPLRIYQRLNLTSAGSTNKTTECPHNGPRFLVSYRSVRSIKEHTGSVEATMVSYLPYTWKRRIRKYQETAGLHRQQRLQG